MTMRFGPCDRVLWLVVDPTERSELDDLVSEVSLADLDLQFKGGLRIDQNPTLFTDRREAEIEAFGRVTAMRASRAIAAQVAAGKLQPGAHRLEVFDGEGKLFFGADLS
jgi:hypothetical protein